MTPPCSLEMRGHHPSSREDRHSLAVAGSVVLSVECLCSFLEALGSTLTPQVQEDQKFKVISGYLVGSRPALVPETLSFVLVLCLRQGLTT